MLKHRLSRVLNGPSVDSFLLLFVRVITLFLGIITTRVLSQELSVADYGTYSEITLLITTLSSLTIFGMTDACNYFYWILKTVTSTFRRFFPCNTSSALFPVF